MFESWYDRHDDEKTRFWLQFQVCSDGFNDTPPNPSSSTTTQTFHLFRLLPPEIRLQIWEQLIRPRIVIAACIDSRSQASKAEQLARRRKLRAAPVLLHICHETRALALKHYELAFAWKTPHRLASAEAGAVPDARDARVWFNFRLDALLLLGELEPFDRYGFNSPMVYFLRREDTRRVRHVACAFEELRLGVHESELVFGCLFHVVDRFPGACGGGGGGGGDGDGEGKGKGGGKRLLISSTPRDEEVSHMVLPTCDNVVQKLWWAWINGTTVVASSLASTQILMIREEDLAEFIEKA